MELRVHENNTVEQLLDNCVFVTAVCFAYFRTLDFGIFVDRDLCTLGGTHMLQWTSGRVL